MTSLVSSRSGLSAGLLMPSFLFPRQIEDVSSNLFNVPQKCLRTLPGCCLGDMYHDTLVNITASATIFNLTVRVTSEVGEGFTCKDFIFFEKSERGWAWCLTLKYRN